MAASDLGNGSGTHLERQVKRQIQVYGDLPLPLAARSVHTLTVRVNGHSLSFLTDVRLEVSADVCTSGLSSLCV